MPTLKPTLLAASLALALASAPSFAQTVSGSTGARATTGASSSSAGISVTPRNQVSEGSVTGTGSNTSTGGCRAGSSCGASSFNDSGSGDSVPTFNTTTSSTVGDSVSGNASAAPGQSSVAGGSGTGFGTNSTTTIPANNQPRFGPGGSFSDDSGNSALGTSAGQTSSGTAAGNSSAGIGEGNALLPGVDPNLVGAAATTVAADGTLIGNTATLGVGANGERVLQQGAAQPNQVTIINTPTFDQAARQGQALEQRRRAAGIEPRIIGIAPNTERDLTHQMPDDPIIRY